MWTSDTLRTLSLIACTLLAAVDFHPGLLIGGSVVLALCALLVVAVLSRYGVLWFQAYMCGADVSLVSLVGMSFRQVPSGTIVTAKIMGTQAGLDINRKRCMSASLI